LSKSDGPKVDRPDLVKSLVAALLSPHSGATVTVSFRQFGSIVLSNDTWRRGDLAFQALGSGKIGVLGFDVSRCIEAFISRAQDLLMPTAASALSKARSTRAKKQPVDTGTSGVTLWTEDQLKNEIDRTEGCGPSLPKPQDSRVVFQWVVQNGPVGRLSEDDRASVRSWFKMQAVEAAIFEGAGNPSAAASPVVASAVEPPRLWRSSWRAGAMGVITGKTEGEIWRLLVERHPIRRADVTLGPLRHYEKPTARSWRDGVVESALVIASATAATEDAVVKCLEDKLVSHVRKLGRAAAGGSGVRFLRVDGSPSHFFVCGSPDIGGGAVQWFPVRLQPLAGHGKRRPESWLGTVATALARDVVLVSFDRRDLATGVAKSAKRARARLAPLQRSDCSDAAPDTVDRRGPERRPSTPPDSLRLSWTGPAELDVFLGPPREEKKEENTLASSLLVRPRGLGLGVMEIPVPKCLRLADKHRGLALAWPSRWTYLDAMHIEVLRIQDAARKEHNQVVGVGGLLEQSTETRLLALGRSCAACIFTHMCRYASTRVALSFVARSRHVFCHGFEGCQVWEQGQSQPNYKKQSEARSNI